MRTKLDLESVQSRRIRHGHYLQGPEPVGCYNTGHAPCILRVHARYFVGIDLDVLDWQARTKLIMSGKRRSPGDTMRMYRTARAAKARFVKLCETRIAENQATREEIAALKAKAKAGDMGATLALGLDY
jgi:hypothetical protein